MALAIHNTHTYRGNSEITFMTDETGLSVTIDTPRLHMRTVQDTEAEYDRYGDLFGSQEVMEKVAIVPNKN